MKQIKIVLIALICVLLFSTAAFAAEDNKTAVEEDLTDLFSDMIGKTIVEDLQSIIANERLQVNLSYEDGTSVSGIIEIENSVITKAEFGTSSDPTLDVYLSAQTYLAIRESPDQIKALLDAYTDGDITTDAHGFGKSVKFGLAGAILHIVSWFS